MKNKGFQTLLYSTGGVLAMAVLLIAFNVVTGVFKERLDLTQEKAYTLSAGTKAILHKIDTPVHLRFYCTRIQNASPQSVMLNEYAGRVQDLLDEYKEVAGGKLIIQKLDPQPDSDAEDSARLDGIQGQPLPNGEKFYLGLAVSVLDQKEAIPFLAPNRERLLEYDVSRAISRVIEPERPVVGIMSAMPVFGTPSNPMMERMGRQGQQPWVIVNELKRDYDVRKVPMDTDKIDSDIKVLLVIHPRDITDKAQFAIDQFVMRGGKLIAFLDPLPMVDVQQQNPMMGSMPNKGSSLDKLIKAWGLSFDTSKVVADMNLKMRIGGPNGQPQEAPGVLSLTTDQMNHKDVVTSELDNLWLPFAGAFTGDPAKGLTETVLLKSTKNSELVDGFMANLASQNIINNFKPSGVQYALAVRLTGQFKTAFPDGPPGDSDSKADAKKAKEKPADFLKETKKDNTVVLVGDADMLYDNVALRQIQSPFGVLSMALNNNLDFAQNAVEQMGGDSDLVAVRSRAVRNRPFTVIKKMQAKAQEAYQSKIKEYEDTLADTERQLSQLQVTKGQDQRVILTPEQQAALQNLSKKKAEVAVKLRQERKKLRRDIDALQNRLTWVNIAGMPVLVTLSGLGLAFYKRKRTSAK
jgi:gliding motility-associatede transport system auxiliary component